MSFRAWLHVLVWSIFFLAGTIDTLSLAPRLLNRIALAGVVALFALRVMTRRRMRWPLAAHVLAIVAIACLSGFLGGQSAAAVATFLRQLIVLPYLYFLVIVNERSDRVIETVRRTIVFFVALQIPAFLLKLAIVGNIEDYVGTVARLEGSMTTLITMIPMAFLFGWYLVYRRARDLVLVVIFVLMSQIGSKRAALVYAPLIIVCVYLFYVRLRGLSLVPLVRGLVVVILLSAVTAYAVIRLNPWLNPDGRVGGRLDLSFALAFAGDYNFSSRDPSSVYDYSRMQALPYLAVSLWESGTLPFLFGEGAGKLTMANPSAPPDVQAGVEEPVAYYYGIRYGARTGIVWIYMQVGIVGTFLFALLLWRLWREIWRHRQAPAHVLAASGVLAVVVLDIATYSMVTLRFFSIYGMLFAYLGVFYRDRLLGRTWLADWRPHRRRRAAKPMAAPAGVVEAR
jgi:hypothetical protein